MTPKSEIFATGKSSDLGETKASYTTSSNDQFLLDRIQSLEEQICQLSTFHKSRTKERNSSRPQSRSHSRKHFDPKGKYCYFHFRFVDITTNSAAENYKACRKFRLFVKDRTTNLHFLVVSGADCSIIPATSKNKQPSDYKLFAANETEIPTYGIKKQKASRFIPKHVNLTHKRLAVAKEEFKFMLDNESIRPSSSQWASPLHLATKKDGTINDILIASTNKRQHEDNLKIIFERLNSYGLKINIFKSVFGVQEIEFLGYLISQEGSRPLPEKVQAIINYKKPETLYDLLTFHALLSFPKPELPLALFTDASDTAIGSVLQQLENDT
ncbi:transposon Ty3-I Gag-Pol polyprotein [Nephila pilipes]|uniref:Transposon Ty3-I Gag-Pol polyprotein n=1 Tax=Nephila pilipes TaxID=299642 RepID=A0A8X6NCJ3_NEPPI|nr:transposon Ty3-I Gag-Pol polyprotein [Nephila pilipes]